MEHNSQELGSPSFLFVVSSSLQSTSWSSEASLTQKTSLTKSLFLAGEQYPLGVTRDEPSRGPDTSRSQDEAATIASGRTSEFQCVPHSPQRIPEAENVARLLSAASIPSAATMDPPPNPRPAIFVADCIDVPRPNPIRVVPRCDADRLSSTTSSSPPRSSTPSNYQSAAAEAIARFRPNHRDVIIGLAPHLFDERAKRPNETPRSNVPLSYYGDSDRIRPSPLRYTVDYDEEEKGSPHVKPKKSLVSRLAEDFVFGEYQKFHGLRSWYPFRDVYLVEETCRPASTGKPLPQCCTLMVGTAHLSQGSTYCFNESPAGFFHSVNHLPASSPISNLRY